MDDDQAEALVDSLLESGRLVPLAPGRYLDAGVAERTLASVTEALGAYHRANPLRPHMPVPRLQTALGSPPPETLQWAVSELSAKGSVVSESGGVRLSSHTAALGPEQESALEALYRWAEEAALAPPSREEACALLAPAGDARSLLELALKSGRLVDAGEYIIAAPALEQAANALAALHAEKGPFAVADARDVWGSSRKYVVPLLEYLDGTGFTRRSGNTRTVTRPPGPREGVR
jgi:selenocysteine-specific elongation factor